MIDTFHEHQLPVRSLGVGLVLEGSAQFLDGHVSVQDGIVAGTAEGKQRKRYSLFIIHFWMNHFLRRRKDRSAKIIIM